MPITKPWFRPTGASAPPAPSSVPAPPKVEPQEVTFDLPPPIQTGRPRKNAVVTGAFVRSTSIRVALTPLEAAAIQRLAQEAGMTVSQWARKAIYRGAGLTASDIRPPTRKAEVVAAEDHGPRRV